MLLQVADQLQLSRLDKGVPFIVGVSLDDQTLLLPTELVEVMSENKASSVIVANIISRPQVLNRVLVSSK